MILQCDNTKTSLYHLLGTRVKMLSAKSGYRASIDPVVLAATIPAQKGDKILDVGCGVGSAAFCLAARIKEIQVTGIDMQERLIVLAREIGKLNGLEDHTRFLVQNLLSGSCQTQSLPFDHVMANPPYNKKGSGNQSPDPSKALANTEGSALLKDWVAFCFERVKDGGTVTFVHRYERKDELISLMKRNGLVTVLPLWPKVRGERAKRVLVQSIKGAGGAIKIKKGLVLHREGLGYTFEAHKILYDAGALII
jgi:tRNA1(Val) A37 N6-methylase TrmN6